MCESVLQSWTVQSVSVKAAPSPVLRDVSVFLLQHVQYLRVLEEPNWTETVSPAAFVGHAARTHAGQWWVRVYVWGSDCPKVTVQQKTWTWRLVLLTVCASSKWASAWTPHRAHWSDGWAVRRESLTRVETDRTITPMKKNARRVNVLQHKAKPLTANKVWAKWTPTEPKHSSNIWITERFRLLSNKF